MSFEMSSQSSQSSQSTITSENFSASGAPPLPNKTNVDASGSNKGLLLNEQIATETVTGSQYETEEKGNPPVKPALEAEAAECEEIPATTKDTSQNPKNADEGTEVDGDSDRVKSKIELADEFRFDGRLTMAPMTRFFFCIVCGCPAGRDCWTCMPKGHPTCNECYVELKVNKCWSPSAKVDNPSEWGLCCGVLKQTKSKFRNFIFENTKVTCRNPKCSEVGIWDAIREHQKRCPHM